MAAKKKYDCVEMKNRIQADLLEEKARLGVEEMERRHTEWLRNSADPLAVWWRSAASKQKTRKTREKVARGSA